MMQIVYTLNSAHCCFCISLITMYLYRSGRWVCITYMCFKHSQGGELQLQDGGSGEVAVQEAEL